MVLTPQTDDLYKETCVFRVRIEPSTFRIPQLDLDMMIGVPICKTLNTLIPTAKTPLHEFHLVAFKFPAWDWKERFERTRSGYV